MSLGQLLDPSFLPEAQVTILAKECLLLVSDDIDKIALEKDSLTIATHALVTSVLDECTVFHLGPPLRLVQKLQLVQNVTAQLLTAAGYQQHTLLLEELNCLPVCYWVKFKVLLLVYKLRPRCLKNHLTPYVSTLCR